MEWINNNSNQGWDPAPADFTLSKREVHVWRASLDVTVTERQQLARALTLNEWRRAQRFYFPSDRAHFITSRGLLRDILSRYQGVPPEHLHFGHNNFGKPFLVSLTGQDTLSFNISHSNALLLVAITRCKSVGIDVEHVRSIENYKQIAQSTFSSQENAMLLSLPAESRLEAFFTCWTRKEAFIKAIGEGLSYPLDRFVVSLTPGKPAAILNLTGRVQKRSRWSLHALSPGPGYVGALAIERCEGKLKFWQYG